MTQNKFRNRLFMNFKTLQELTLEYFTQVWNHFDGHKGKTAKALGISMRTAFNYKKKCIELGYPIIKPKTKQNLDRYGFPTNEARLRYRDEMINRDR